ncbi:MAG: hypothetical protein ACTSWR_08275 [Candidatus Helarchaeota archaeon]
MNTIKYGKPESAFQSGIGDYKDLEVKIENQKLYIHNGLFYHENTPYWWYGKKKYKQFIVPSNCMVILDAKENIYHPAPITITAVSDNLNYPYNKIYNYNSVSDNYYLHQPVPNTNLGSNDFYVYVSNEYVYLVMPSNTINQTFFAIYDTAEWYESDYELDSSKNFDLYDKFIVLQMASDEYPAEINLGADIQSTFGPNEYITLLASVYDRFGTPLPDINIQFSVLPSEIFIPSNFTFQNVITDKYGKSQTTYLIPSNLTEALDARFFAKCATIDPITNRVNYISSTIVINITKEREYNV